MRGRSNVREGRGAGRRRRGRAVAGPVLAVVLFGRDKVAFEALVRVDETRAEAWSGRSFEDGGIGRRSILRGGLAGDGKQGEERTNVVVALELVSHGGEVGEVRLQSLREPARRERERG